MLKSLADVAHPDPRHFHSALFSYEPGVPRPRSLAELHAIVSRIDVSRDAPEEVWENFQTARNLVVYSWFVYRFATVAELHAYTCVELALQERVGGTLGRTPGLRRLLKHALDEGWLVDDGFRRGRERIARYESGAEDRKMMEEHGIRFKPLDPDPQYYARIICDTAPPLRNYLAHGASAALRGALSTLETCAEIINQVFGASRDGVDSGGVATDESAVSSF